MDVKSQSVLETLKEMNKISIPLYQRPYCWEKAEVATLCEDISNLIEDLEPKHFLGPLVFEYNEKEDIHNLVDGQQRVTTLFMLLYILSSDVDAAREALELCTFIPAEKDTRTYGDINRGDLRKDDKSNMAERYRQINAVLCNLSAEQRADYCSALLNRLITVNIVVTEQENAYAIFESLNSKGKELEPFDLIRNYLLMNLPENRRKDIYNIYIKPLEQLTKSVHRKRRKNKRDVFETIEIPCVNEFIRCYVMLTGEYVAERDIYPEFKKAFEDYIKNSENTPEDFVRELHDVSEHFDKIVNPGKVKDRELGNQLNRLLMLSTETYFPLALSIYIAYIDDDIPVDVDEAIELLKVLEVFIIRTVIGNRKENKSLNKLFPTIGPRLFANNTETPPTPKLLRNLLVSAVGREKQVYALSDSIFAEIIREYALYGGSSRNLCSLALYTLEAEMSNKEQVIADFTEIEHIMPETLTSEWRTALGEDWEDVHRKYLHTIGNLTYLPKSVNVSVGNDPYEKKREAFIQSKFALNDGFEQISKWDKEEIEKRGKRLADILAGVWTAFTDLDEDTLQESKERISDKQLTSFILNGNKIEVPGGKGSTFMQIFYTHLMTEYPQLFEKVIRNQSDLIGTQRVDSGKLRSIEVLGDSGYVVGVGSSLEQKLKDIGQTLQIMGIEPENFKAITPIGEVIRSIAPGGMRSRSAKTPNEVVVDGVSIEKHRKWSELYVEIVSLLLEKHPHKAGNIPEKLISNSDEGMRSPKDINVNGETLFIEKHSNTKQKKENLIKICNSLGIDKGKIVLDGESL